MFEPIGRFATRYRRPIIAVWIALAAIITLAAPHIDDVASSDQADFLPSNAPFIAADQVFKDAFPAGIRARLHLRRDRRQPGGRRE